MSLASPSHAGMQFAIVLVALAIFAGLIAPFSYGDHTALVPPDHDLDATLATLVVAESVDRLLSNPRSFYDTAILYPDRTQLRSTEPFLGFSLLALPLRTVFHLNDVDVYEMLRWLMLFASLLYAYLLFTTAGVGIMLSVAGAAACLCQPNLLTGVERLQVISITLIFPVLYHGVMVWTGRGSRTAHGLGLGFWTAMYPLCGAINATVGVVAGIFLLPLLLKIGLESWREKRLLALALPLFAAAALDGVLLAPWLFDRADMAVYTSPSFLAIKSWRATLVPLRLVQVPLFLVERIGPSAIVACFILAVLVLFRLISRRPGGRGDRPAGSMPQALIWLVPILLLTMAGFASYGITRYGMPWLGMVFDAGCLIALVAFWLGQLRLPAVSEHEHVGEHVMLASAGLGAFLCLVSFGPVYVSNRHPLASHLTTALLAAVPPLKAIREFDRVWVFGILFLTVYVVVRIGRALAGRAPIVHWAAATVLLVSALATVYSRPLVASAAIEAPKDFVAVAATSTSRGAIYVHPYMKWNSRSGVLMIAIARALGRPVVNGYLGISLPWFSYAANVLHRFPDPEALWLLRKWHVDTVVSLAGDVQSQELEGSHKVFQQQAVVVWEVPQASYLSHPSGPAPLSVDARERVDTPWKRLEARDVATIAVNIPTGFLVGAVEVHFGQTAVPLVPTALDVYGVERGARVRLNEGQSGMWLESLAADALVHRESPVATVRLMHPTAGDLEIECANSSNPPIDRVVLLGARAR